MVSNLSYIKQILALSSFIMAWEAVFDPQAKSYQIKRIHPYYNVQHMAPGVDVNKGFL